MNQGYYDKLLKLEALVYHFTDVNGQELKRLITNDADLEREFLHKVCSLDWFQWIKATGYFDPETVKFDGNEDALFWNILDYLERVSEQVVQNIQYGKALIDIIDSLVQFSLNKKRINNYHIWWYCVKILNNLPSVTIKDHLTIEKFKQWLSVWTYHPMGSDLTINDIGEKLLPKFLHNDFGPDYIYAENIVYTITMIKAGGKSNAFTKRDDAVMVCRTYWIVNAFKKHGQVIGEKCSIRVVFEIADRLSEALKYKQKEHYTNIKVGDTAYQIKVSRIYADGLVPGQIRFKDNEYECVVRQFSKEQLANVDRKNDFWALHNIEPQVEVNAGRFVFTALTKDLFVAEIRKNLPKDINWESADNLEQKILDVYVGLYSDYSHIWCRTLKSGPEHGEGADDILTISLRDVLLAKCKENSIEGEQVLNLFLNDNKYQFPLFRRFVLLCVDKFWDKYFFLLDKLINVVPTVLEESDLELEMYDVLKNHNSAFAPGLKTKLKNLINNVPDYYVSKGDEKLIAYWKYKWLSPLRDNSDFKSLYEEAKQKAEPKDGKPYDIERFSSKGGFISHKSPITKEEILLKPVAELAKFLSDFNSPDFWEGAFIGEPDKEGLADDLQAAVKEDPKKFADNLDAFMFTNYFYLKRIFRGFREAWNEGSEIDWSNIFNFSTKYLTATFKAQVEEKVEGHAIWIVEEIVELIGDGSRDDKRAFAPKYFDQVEKIFNLIFPELKGEKNPDAQRDALTYALNTTFGRIIIAYLSFSLRVARVTQNKNDNWGNDKFERLLSAGIEGYIWLGAYLPQMKFLDNAYTVKKIDYFAKEDAPKFEWQMFMEGYLTRARVYKDIYGLMRENYAKALDTTIFKGEVDKRLVEHICVGYLQLGEALAQNNENENGNPSLFWKMLDEANNEDTRVRWEDVASFFWSISRRTLKEEEKDGQEEPSEGTKQKVIDFWAWTFKEQEYVKDKLRETYGSFLSKMSELTIWLDKIDDTTEKWLLLSVPHIEIHHGSAFFIEYLTKFTDDESVKRIGKVFLKVLETTTPTFRQEDIQLIIELLYKVGEKDGLAKADADNICNTYGRRGIHFLKDLFFKYQKK